jgi:YegS/Rv2252/BmrU family lipid kinase
MSPPLEKHYALIVNPSAGSGRALRLLPEVERLMDQRRMVFRSSEHGVELALEAVAAHEVPVVMSGDGLLGAIGGALAGSDAALGLIPGGRGNDLARGLGVPSEPAEAIKCLDEGFERTIDVGEANGQRFLGIASLGFDSDANRIANDAKFLKGSLVYAYAALRALAAWRPARFHLTQRGQQRRFTGYSVVVANNAFYGGGMNVAPGADLSDGKLDVVIVGEVSKFRYLISLPKVFSGSHINNDEVQTWKTSAVEISASRPFTVYADGDPLTELPARIRTLPGALRIIVPEDRP